ncbi:MAG: AAA family ATPase [Planctomycetes bacterium]|nr:AAA family ATPase [Planctomycetota bacterium]
MATSRARVKAQAPGETTTVRGVVATVFFASPKFSAGRLRAADGTVLSFAGEVVVREHQPVVLTGSWERHPKYGRQFKATSLLHDLAPDTDGLALYLANHPDLPGIGPVKARRIAEAFGADFERALDEYPEEVAEVAGVPFENVEILRTEWARTRTVNAALTWLSAYGLTYHQVTTLVDAYGENVVPILKADPYVIVGAIPGFGFKRVDVVARKLGTPKDHPSRLTAGVAHCVDARVEDGDCWIDYEVLVEAANDLLVLDTLDSRTRIEAALEELLSKNRLACVSIGGRFLVARPRLYAMERDLAAWVALGSSPNPHFGPGENLNLLIDRVAPDLLDGQRSAVRTALSHAQTLISGGAGSGKTYTIAAIARACERRGLSVVLAAPTGKAAKRLEQVVGRDAVTIHRLLEFNGDDFKRNHDEPLDADVVIIDEVSMLDVPLAWHLYDALRLGRTALVLVGDHNQLPPVGPGNVLRDLIERRPLPTVVLDEIVRQAGALKMNSIAVLAGEVRKTAPAEEDGRRPWYLVDQFTDPLDVQRFLVELYRERLAERLRFDLLSDVQLLTPQKKGPLGVRDLNVLLQRLLQKKLWGVDAPEVPEGRRPELLVHDKVIQTRNNYELGVMNGAIGFVVEVGPQKGDLVVEFEGGLVQIRADRGHAADLQLAYALTIHKAQGSEFPCAVVIVHKAHSFMHHRNLFYTAVTRAQETAVVIGDRWGLRNCAAKEQVERRKTFLSVLSFPPEEGTL